MTKHSDLTVVVKVNQLYKCVIVEQTLSFNTAVLFPLIFAFYSDCSLIQLLS